MSINLGRKLCRSALVATGVFAGCIARSDTPHPMQISAPAPVIWRLDDPAKIGGNVTEVFGAPQVVVEQGLKALVFDGKSDGMLIPVIPITGWKQFTIEVLIKPDGTGAEEQRFIHIQDKLERRAMVETRVLKDCRWTLDTYLRADQDHNLTLIDRTKTHPTDQWHWVALVYDGQHMAHFVNGVKELEGEVALPPMTEGVMSIGVRQNKVFWYKGAIREVRFSPVALAPAALQHVEVK